MAIECKAKTGQGLYFDAEYSLTATGREDQAMVQENDDLLDALNGLGCGVEKVEGGVLVSLPGDYDEFIFERMGEWLYIGTTLMSPDEFEDSGQIASLDRFMLTLQHRNLGCHFSYDGTGYLTIGAELCPEQQQADEVLHTMEQISFVIDACLPLCDQVLATGEIPDHPEVDRAFGLNEKLH